jgi:gluconokinase
MIVVVMGVSGAGKSSVGAALAHALGCAFLDGDELHPAANIDKMRRGIPLDDADRAPWLDAIAAHMREAATAGRDLVVACSALKQSYRRRLAIAPEVRFVLLEVPEAVLRARLERRREHFMPPSLLPSQLAALEPPDAGEIVVDGAQAIDDVVCQIRRAIAR